MATLKHAGIVRTTLGSHGGYAISVPPETVSLGRIIRLLDGALAPLPCVSLRYYESCSCPDEATCPLRDAMIDVRDAMLDILDQGNARRPRRPTRSRVHRSAWPPRGRPGRPATVARRFGRLRRSAHVSVPDEAAERGLDPVLEGRPDTDLSQRGP